MSYEAGLSPEEALGRGRAEGVLKLSSNENPFGPSPLAVAAVAGALAELHRYPHRDDAALKAALAQRHAASGLSAEHFFVANSGCDVLMLAAQTCLTPGTSAIMCPPTFGFYRFVVAHSGAELTEVALEPDTFALRPEAVLAAVRPDTRLLFMCNPNNPTGTVLARGDLRTLLDALPEHVTVIYDEAYYQFAEADTLPNALAEVRTRPNLVVMHTFAKAYGLAGLRLGYGVAPPDLVERVEARKRVFYFSTLALVAGEAALRDEAHVAKTVANNTTERRRLREALAALGVRTWPSQANFVLFECPGGRTAKGVVAELMERGVMTRAAFDLPHHVRVTVGLPAANKRFIEAVRTLV